MGLDPLPSKRQRRDDRIHQAPRPVPGKRTRNEPQAHHQRGAAGPGPDVLLTEARQRLAALSRMEDGTARGWQLAAVREALRDIELSTDEPTHLDELAALRAQLHEHEHHHDHDHDHEHKHDHDHDPRHETPLADPLHATAAAGVDAATSPLPFGDVIQLAFGRHSVRGIRAQVGGSASSAAGAIGARAYAIGNRVAFAGAPDLHTAAHEAAHVVQQRAGVSLLGGVGTPGDLYEQHADRVADAVVAGHSAEGILDELAPRRASSAPSIAVQCDGQDGLPPQLVNAPGYLRHNANEALAHIARHLRAVPWPDPHPRLGWRDRDRSAFLATLVTTLVEQLSYFDPPAHLWKLTFPTNPLQLIDAIRPIAGTQAPQGDNMYVGGDVGPTTWAPAVGTALAQLLEERIDASLRRMGPRWIAAAESVHGPLEGAWVSVPYESLPTSHWIDRVVGRAIAAPGVLDLRAGDGTRPGAIALRPVQLEWQGERSPGLWNWVRAVEPADATAEEVAAALFNDRADLAEGEQASFYACGLTAAPPLFGLPTGWATRFAGARAHAPASDEAIDTGAAQITTVAGSDLADEISLAQAASLEGEQPAVAKAPPGAVALLEVLDRSSIQATFLAETLAPWGLSGPVAVTLAWIERKQSELATSDEATRARWAVVLEAQTDALRRIGGAVVQIDRGASEMRLGDRTAAAAAPLREVLHTYADAIAASHLPGTCGALVERAAHQQAQLPLRMVLGASQAMGASIDAMHGAEPVDDLTTRELAGAGAAVQEDARRLASRLMAGSPATAGEIEDVTLAAGEVALRSRVHAIGAQLDRVIESARSAGDGLLAGLAARMDDDFAGLENAAADLRWELDHIVARMRPSVVDPNAASAMTAEEIAERNRTYRREALAAAEARFATVDERTNIGTFLRRGAELIESQVERTIWIKLATLIGVSIAGGVLGRLAAARLGGAMATASPTVVRIATAATQVTVDSAITSAGQAATYGDSYWAALAENGIASILALPLGGLGRGLDDLRAIDRQAATVWQRLGGTFVLRHGVHITADTIYGVASGYVARRIVTGERQPPPETVKQWLGQAASVALGRHIGDRIHDRMARMRPFAALPGARQLLAEDRALAQRVSDPEHATDPQVILDYLALEQRALERHIAFVHELEAPERLRATSLDPADLAALKEHLETTRDERQRRAFAELPLRLSGLEEVIPGAIWTGSRAAIERAERSISAAHPDAQITHDDATGDRRFSFGPHSLVVRVKREHDLSGASRPATPEEIALARRMADVRARSHEKLTHEELSSDHAAFVTRREVVEYLLERAKVRPDLLPKGVSHERLLLAVKGDPVTGERVPLTYGADIESARREFAEFRAEVAAAFQAEGITDAVVVQLGSGTTGWSSAPDKVGKPWSTTSDVDFAIFSDQALAQAFRVGGGPINIKNKQGDRYTTLKNGPEDGIPGFYFTPLGRRLEAIAKKWNLRKYGDPEADGFDFKLNLASDRPFKSAVSVVQVSDIAITPTHGARAVAIPGREGPYLGVAVRDPRLVLPTDAKGRREFHITVLSPPELAALPADRRRQVEAGIDIAGEPVAGAVTRQDIAGTMAYRIEVEWPEAQAFRATLGLANKDFHVSLSGGIGDAIRARDAAKAGGED